MFELAWLILLLPLFSALSILWLGIRASEWIVFISVITHALCFFLALAVALHVITAPSSLPWIQVRDLQISMGLNFDAISISTLVFVTGAMLFIQLHALASWVNSPSRTFFFACLPGHLFTVIGLILADNLMGLLIFGLLLSVSVYLTLAFSEGRVAVVTLANRSLLQLSGASGILIFAILSCWMLISPHTLSVRPENLSATGIGLNYQKVQVNSTPDATSKNDGGVIYGVTTSLVGNLLGDSAFWIVLLMIFSAGIRIGFIPFHAWIMDTLAVVSPQMAVLWQGVTVLPMGIYLLVRLYPYLLLSPVALGWGVGLCALTTWLAALWALRQKEMYQKLHWLSLSQIGLMGMMVCDGKPTQALYYLFCFGLSMTAIQLSLISRESGGWTRRQEQGLIGAIILGWLFLICLGPLSALIQSTMVIFSVLIFIVALCGTRVFQQAQEKSQGNSGILARSKSQVVLILGSLLVLISSPLLLGLEIGGYGLNKYLQVGMDQILKFAGISHVQHHILEPAAGFSGLRAFESLLLIGTAMVISFYFPFGWWERSTQKNWNISRIYRRFVIGDQRKQISPLSWFDAWILDGFLIRGMALLMLGVGEILRLGQNGSIRGYVYLTILSLLILITLSLTGLK